MPENQIDSEFLPGMEPPKPEERQHTKVSPTIEIKDVRIAKLEGRKRLRKGPSGQLLEEPGET